MAAESEPFIVRTWMGPAGEMLDVDDNGLSHGMSVALAPETFGLPSAPFVEHLAQVNDCDADADFDFDYDMAIVLAEEQGWVRVSRDARGDLTAAVAGSTKASLKAAVLKMLKTGSLARDVSIQLEIETLFGNDVIVAYHHMTPEQTFVFARSGNLPDPSYQGVRHMGDSSLAEAVRNGEFEDKPGMRFG